MADAMKLLPCPFCGTSCHNIAWPREFEGRMVAKIECFTDGCYALVTGESPSLAAAAWNRRASPPAREEALAEGAGDAGREAVWKVVHEVWLLLDDAETNSAGVTTPDQERWNAVSEAMGALEALVPESAGPFWGGYPVNYLWPKGVEK